METSLLQAKCSGCGKVENGTTFKACPTCLELKMLPSVYCCEECFRVDWKTHKKKHNEFADIKSKYVEHLESCKGDPALEKIVSNPKKYRKDVKRMSQDMQMERSYSQTLSLIASAMIVMDYNKAENLCRKAIEEFPSNPEPYEKMSHILFQQNELNDAMRFRAVSIEKTCRILLTAEKKTNGPVDLHLSHSWQRGQFLARMHNIFHYLQTNIESFNIVDWVMNDKKFMSLWSYFFQIIKDKSSLPPGNPKLPDPKSVNSLLQSRRNQTNQQISCNISSSPYFNGEWVIAHGLTSSVGKTLNHRVAMVKGDELNEEGRVPVVFEEGCPIRYLKVDNLKHARTVNAKAAILMFLEESEQWRFMMDDFLTV